MTEEREKKERKNGKKPRETNIENKGKAKKRIRRMRIRKRFTKRLSLRIRRG